MKKVIERINTVNKILVASGNLFFIKLTISKDIMEIKSSRKDIIEKILYNFIYY